MRVISLNVNGIRSAARKGFYEWLAEQDADIVCLQETKAQMSVLQDDVFYPAGYHAYFSDAEKPGYSGTGIYCRQEPLNVITHLGWPEADNEGRYVQVDFEKLSVASLYLPSGSSSDARQTVKFDFLERYLPLLQAQRAQTDREFIICGDWNIAHKIIDIKNWRGNQKNSGFLPEERAWLDHLFDEVGFVDAFRLLNQEEHQYTWWSNRGKAWDNNVGWRIDYQIISPGLKDKVTAVNIYKEQRFSDHAPLTIDYTMDIA